MSDPEAQCAGFIQVVWGEVSTVLIFVHVVEALACRQEAHSLNGLWQHSSHACMLCHCKAAQLHNSREPKQLNGLHALPASVSSTAGSAVSACFLYVHLIC